MEVSFKGIWVATLMVMGLCEGDSTLIIMVEAVEKVEKVIGMDIKGIRNVS